MADRPFPSDRNRSETLAVLAREHPGLEVAAAELGVQLWSTAAGLVRAFEAHLQRYGLTSARFAVLLTLVSAPDRRRTPSDLADRINVRRPTLTGIVDGLVAAGLVRRDADPERRRNQWVELTAAGRKTILAAAPDHFTRLAAATGAFSAPEQATLRRALALMERFAGELER